MDGLDLSYLRRRAKVKQRELAEQMGVSRSRVAQMEMLRRPLRPEAVARYRKALAELTDGAK